MHRTQYLGTHTLHTTPHVVRDFVNWLGANLSNQRLFAHRYIDRRTQHPWQFNGLEDACRQYRWKHKGLIGVPAGDDLPSNHAALNALRMALQHSLKLDAPASDQAACAAASAVMVWGGVQAKNVSWLQANIRGLAPMLVSTTTALNSASLINPILQRAGLRFNAGMTKVYALLADDLIIYDSRVAAALGWIVVKYCQAHRLTSVPSELAFPWAPAKEARTAASPKNRNPAQHGLLFPRLSAGPRYAEWNLKASWVLQAALAQDTTSQFAQPSTISALRRLEAALFMIGYDLPQPNKPTLGNSIHLDAIPHKHSSIAATEECLGE